MIATAGNTQTFTVSLNGSAYTASYKVEGGLVRVDSIFGNAAASAIGESNYATAITLFFGILSAARSADQI